MYQSVMSKDRYDRKWPGPEPKGIGGPVPSFVVAVLGVVWCHAGFSCILMLVLMEIKCGRAELSCAIIICYVISPNLLHQIKLQNYIYFQPFTSHKAAASLELELSAKNLRRTVKKYFQSRW